MIFNSISNQYNSKAKLGVQNQHIKRMRMIESQRVTYLPSSSSSVKSNSRVKFNTTLTPKRSPIQTNHHIMHINSYQKQRKNFVNQYPATYSTLGQINKQLADSTNYIQYRESIKRSQYSDNKDGYFRDNRSYSSHIRRANSRQSLDQHPDRVLQTQYTLNPMHDKDIDQVSRERERNSKSGNSLKNGSSDNTQNDEVLSKPVIASKLQKVVTFVSPSNLKQDRQAQFRNNTQFAKNNQSQLRPQLRQQKVYNSNQNIKFSYGSHGISNQERPHSRVKKPMFNPNHHYFPISQSIGSITRKPILDTNDSNYCKRYSQVPTSDLKTYSRTFPEPDRQGDQEIDRFFDMDFKAGKMMDAKTAENLTKYKQNKIQSPLGLAQLQAKKSSSINSKIGIVQNLMQKLQNLDRDGKMVVFGLIGIALLLLILQTIQ